MNISDWLALTPRNLPVSLPVSLIPEGESVAPMIENRVMEPAEWETLVERVRSYFAHTGNPPTNFRKRGYVYAIRFPNGLVRIGHTPQSPDTKNWPPNIELVRIFRCSHARLVKEKIHEYFANWHVTGEYFRLPDPHLHDLKLREWA